MICHRIKKKKAQQIFIKRICFRTSCLFRKSDVERKGEKICRKILQQRKYFFLETICMTFYTGNFQFCRNSVLHWMFSWQWRQSSCPDIIETRRKEETYVSAVIEKIPTTTTFVYLFWAAYLKSKHGFSRPGKENHICPTISGQCNDYKWRGGSH